MNPMSRVVPVPSSLFSICGRFSCFKGVAINLVVPQPIGAMGKARVDAGGMVKGLTAPLGKGQTGALGFHHGHDVAVQAKDVVGGLGAF